MVKDSISFCDEICDGILGAQENDIITFGIKPNYPETGYGYIKTSKKYQFNNIFKVEKFVEKPNLINAENFVKKDEYLWNSGIFLFKPDAIVDCYRAFIPEIMIV